MFLVESNHEMEVLKLPEKEESGDLSEAEQFYNELIKAIEEEEKVGKKLSSKKCQKLNSIYYKRSFFTRFFTYSKKS